MDKKQKYILNFSEINNRWEVISEDAEEFGFVYDTELRSIRKDMAAALAVLDLCGYDVGIIQEELDIEKEE